jgi:hypothetical protein
MFIAMIAWVFLSDSHVRCCGRNVRKTNGKKTRIGKHLRCRLESFVKYKVGMNLVNRFVG